MACGPHVFLQVSLNIFCLLSLYELRCYTEASYDLFYTMTCLNVTYSCTCHALPWITGAHTHLCQCCKSQSLHLYPRFLAVCLSRVLYCAKSCGNRYFFSFRTSVLHSAGCGCQRKVKWKWTECSFEGRSLLLLPHSCRTICPHDSCLLYYSKNKPNYSLSLCLWQLLYTYIHTHIRLIWDN